VEFLGGENMVKGKIVDKIKVAELKSSELSPVIPQTPVETVKTLISAEPIIEERVRWMICWCVR
jgi:hypothetical protein